MNYLEENWQILLTIISPIITFFTGYKIRNIKIKEKETDVITNVQSIYDTLTKQIEEEVKGLKSSIKDLQTENKDQRKALLLLQEDNRNLHIQVTKLMSENNNLRIETTQLKFENEKLKKS